MFIPVYKDSTQTDRIKKFDNDLFFFKGDENKPFAFRSRDVNCSSFSAAELDNLLFDVGAFSLYEKDGELFCLYRGARKVLARVSPLDNEKRDNLTVQRIEDYLLKAYRLDPLAVSVRAAFEAFESLVTSASEFCGCLTDVLHDNADFYDIPPYALSVKNINCEHIALSLPIISLMFRRISALRGFNFKVTVKDYLPCLIFSARVLFTDNEGSPDIRAIREYSELRDILGDDGLIIGAKLKEVDDDDESCETVYRLSLAICPQTVDPRGILRAPVWRRQAQNIIDGLNIDLDGKY